MKVVMVLTVVLNKSVVLFLLQTQGGLIVKNTMSHVSFLVLLKLNRDYSSSVYNFNYCLKRKIPLNTSVYLNNTRQVANSVLHQNPKGVLWLLARTHHLLRHSRGGWVSHWIIQAQHWLAWLQSSFAYESLSARSECECLPTPRVHRTLSFSLIT